MPLVRNLQTSTSVSEVKLYRATGSTEPKVLDNRIYSPGFFYLVVEREVVGAVAALVPRAVRVNHLPSTY